ncbi:Protein of unknown function [Pyronema omphalodes CBS 100304]|uniref:Uncharacterized protein n=1 Tax=Pyronema omphalodes (strain CBS 100304) TaxID=1076935 RepID=U4KUQ6_PYROM|nr:Protein of unknown function [Pyronema omphalodes CBS 100304]
MESVVHSGLWDLFCFWILDYWDLLVRLLLGPSPALRVRLLLHFLHFLHVYGLCLVQLASAYYYLLDDTDSWMRMRWWPLIRRHGHDQSDVDIF